MAPIEEGDVDNQALSDFYIPDVDSSTTDDEIIFPGGSSSQSLLPPYQKSLTLPNNQNNSSGYHKRSLSESKTFEIIRGSDNRGRDFRFTADIAQRHRDNSVTESTTSGVSSCDSITGRNTLKYVLYSNCFHIIISFETGHIVTY